MTHQANKKLIRGILVPGVSALVLAAIVGCNTTSSNGDKGPVITQQPRDTSLVEGTHLVMTVAATNASSYKWVKGTSDTLAGQTTATLTLSNVPATENGSTYKALAVGSNGAVVESNSFTLTVGTAHRAMLRDSGDVLFTDNCSGCHGAMGEGGRGPRVGNSDFLMNMRERVISILIRGNMDTVVVNGQCVTGGGMPPGGGNDEVAQSNFKIASILTYVRTVLNDSIPTNCNTNGECTMTARTDTQIAQDSLAVWEVKAVRDTLSPYPDGYEAAVCTDPA